MVIRNLRVRAYTFSGATRPTNVIVPHGMKKRIWVGNKMATKPALYCSHPHPGALSGKSFFMAILCCKLASCSVEQCCGQDQAELDETERS